MSDLVGNPEARLSHVTDQYEIVTSKKSLNVYSKMLYVSRDVITCIFKEKNIIFISNIGNQLETVHCKLRESEVKLFVNLNSLILSKI